MHRSRGWAQPVTINFCACSQACVSLRCDRCHMSTHPIGIATMAALLCVIFLVVLVGAIAVTMRLDRHHQARTVQARAHRHPPSE